MMCSKSAAAFTQLQLCAAVLREKGHQRNIEQKKKLKNSLSRKCLTSFYPALRDELPLRTFLRREIFWVYFIQLIWLLKAPRCAQKQNFDFNIDYYRLSSYRFCAKTSLFSRQPDRQSHMVRLLIYYTYTYIYILRRFLKYLIISARLWIINYNKLSMTILCIDSQ